VGMLVPRAAMRFVLHNPAARQRSQHPVALGGSDMDTLMDFRCRIELAAHHEDGDLSFAPHQTTAAHGSTRRMPVGAGVPVFFMSFRLGVEPGT